MSQDDEVVEVFVGDSLEQAMAYAVAALGPDLQVRRARKVRKGVAGLAGRDKYEVVAVPAEATAVDADPVENAFDALLSQAEQAELPPELQRPVRRTTRPAPEPAAVPAPRPTPPPALPVAEHDEVLAVVRAHQAPPEPEPAPEPAAVAPPKAPAAKKAAARTAAKRAPRVKAVPLAPSGWSRTALADLGVPAEVLAGLPAEDPADDLAWAAALAAAIATVLPAPAALSEADPVVVDGHGVAGALGILRAAGLGLTPGTITTGTRTVPASAAELALVLRSAVIA